jgi:hypothetical protein
MPNIDILLQKFPSGLLQAVIESNRLKQKDLDQNEWRNWKPGMIAASLDHDI